MPHYTLLTVVICACVYLVYTTDLDLIIDMHTILIANIYTIGKGAMTHIENSTVADVNMLVRFT